MKKRAYMTKRGEVTESALSPQEMTNRAFNDASAFLAVKLGTNADLIAAVVNGSPPSDNLVLANKKLEAFRAQKEQLDKDGKYPAKWTDMHHWLKSVDVEVS